jgi:lysophospholipase L1-like esterase
MKILFFFGIVSCFLFGACTKNTEAVVIKEPTPSPPVSTKPGVGNLTYLALGDSYTIGQSVQAYQNFPNQLVSKLRADQNIVVDAKIIAQTGWTTGDLKSAIKSTNLAPKYDFVTLLIGVNNQYRGANINTYRKEFIELLQTSITYAGGDASHVFVLSIPDYSVTPFAGNNENTKSKIASEIDAYNQIDREEAQKLEVNFLDITPISRKAKNEQSLIAPDGLHPSAEMYKQWVELLTPMVVSKLK